jgi:chorismate mutase
MSETAPLEETTREVDALDASLTDLIMRRLNAPDAASHNPAREAQLMRALALRWHTDVPQSVGLHIFRELLAASWRRHAPVSLHVADTERDLTDLARAHFGSPLPMTVYPTASMVVQALADDRHAIGVVPVPASDDGQPGWWSNLSPPDRNGPRVVGKLPFFQGDASPMRRPPAYALASVPVTASGDDTTLIVVSLHRGLSRARIGQVVKTATLDAQIIAMGRDQPERAPRCFLIEAAGFLSASDQRLQALKAHGGEEIADVALIGAYANPVVFNGSKP